MTRSVVFGTGQVGSHVVSRLLADGEAVVAVSRHGRRHFAGAVNRSGDATDPAFTTDVCAGADTVYFCLDAPDYHRWPEQFPPLQRAVLAAAQASGARLVVLENLYGYGPRAGRVLTESLPMNAVAAKARTRVAMTEELLAAHAAGSVQVAIGRASDYFGPGTTHSALGELVFAAALRGKTAQIMGDPDRRHSYSYTPDVAAGLVALGRDPQAAARVWHLPISATWTTRDVIGHLYEIAGHKPKLFAAGRFSLGAYGLVNPAMREYRHTLYQFTDDWQVSDDRFRARFGDLSTPIPEALSATLDWYAARIVTEVG